MFKNNIDYEIETPDGFIPFKGIQKVVKKNKIQIFLYNGKHVSCSPNHRLKTVQGWKIAQEINYDDIVVGKGFESKVFHVEYVSGEFEYYDVVGVDNKQFFANDILSHNCLFLGSTNTLIHPNKLRMMTFVQPLYEKNNLKCYEEVQKNHTYVIVVDTSRGLGQDYSAFVVFDITEYPYRGVALYRSKDISPLMYPNVVYNAAKKYNDAFVLVEINDIGEQVSNIIYYDLEYENIFKITQRNGLQGISSGFGSGRSQLGVRTTKSVKRIGCSTLKDVIEQDKLIFEDYSFVNELSNFVQIRESYEADDGYHDDVVMCAVLFAWLIRQDYFKELSNSDLRKKMYEDNQKLIEDEMLPFGFLDDGHDNPDIINIDTDRLGWSLPPIDSISEKW